ncbi:CHASE2 domain-containing protein [Halomicronema sp. CCY15110]|uniref:CHASE2 domain-containing protein n=1 Tax=Halomicronema sp. CCY15110 TaxID=2767773 RepID=UPI00195138BC|nr:CHASE2 domain-containing protein [Halomicronema sp. CCY15110]
MTEQWLNERYRVLRPLGQGGFAQTYLAVDEQRSQLRCVIKHLMPADTSAQFLATARRLFQSEVQVMRRLGNHPAIPTLLDAFELAGEFYLVQEFIDGDALSDRFNQLGKFGEAEAVELLTAVLQILAFIHQEQVVHRDIKPSNLMRRQADGQYVLIDFGAVKEITTELGTANSERFTVSIGTQGYAAPEQMAGRPRYSSDLYALGMTVIRGLTGRSPTELPENPVTGELQWIASAPAVSDGLKVFLNRLTHVSIYQRYPSAAAALADLAQYQELATPSATALATTELSPSDAVKPGWQLRAGRQAIAAVVIVAIVLLIRHLGGWVPIELWLHDQWVLRQPLPPVDDRLLVVEITEADLMRLQQPTPSDAVLAELITTLQTYDPQVIGLDLYRDIPQGDGHDQLLAALAADNVVAIRQLGTSPSERIPAPRGMPPERVGFNDFPVDADGVVRRSLIYATADDRPDTEIFHSLALRLALAYLQPRGLVPRASAVNAEYLALNDATFVPLEPNFGGYRQMDAAGYQIMLQYRGANDTIPTITIGEILDGQFQAEMIRDRIILIGTTAASAKDFFLTPYSATAEEDFLMSGVMLHAHATSQIVAAALDGQPLPWAVPEAVELVWIVGGATGGVILGRQGKRLRVLGLGLVAGSIVLVGVPIGVATQAGWLPVVPAVMAFAGSAIAAALIQTYTTDKIALANSWVNAWPPRD